MSPSTISGALRSRDTDLMIGALQTLGLRIDGDGSELAVAGGDRAGAQRPGSTAGWPAPCCASSAAGPRSPVPAADARRVRRRRAGRARPIARRC